MLLFNQSLNQYCSSENRFVSLKIVRSASECTEAALDEVKLLKCVCCIAFTLLCTEYAAVGYTTTINEAKP